MQITTGAAVEADAHADGEGRRAYRWRLIRSLLLGQVASGSSLTIIALATREIARDLHTPETVVAWSVTGGVLASAVGGAIGGKLGDTYGHRKLYRMGLAAVVVSTVAGALAWSGPLFLLARVLAGVSSGVTSANSTAMVLHAFPANERTRAIGMYQSALTLAPALGLLVGGPMIDAFGWRTMFWVFVVLVAIGYVWSWAVVREDMARIQRRIDYVGSVSLAGAVVGILLYFDRARAFGLTDITPLVSLGAGLVSVVVFVVAESRVPEPLFRLDYFRRRNFIVPTLVTTMLNYAFMGGLVVTPLLLHQRFGYSNTRSAVLLFLRPFGYSITAAGAGNIQRRVSVRAAAAAGGVLVTASMVCFALGARHTTLWLVVAGLALSGVGLGIATPGLTASAANASDPRDFGVTSGMRTTLTQVGVTAGIQSMTIMLGGRYTEASFAGSFWLGCAVAVTGTALVLAVRD